MPTINRASRGISFTGSRVRLLISGADTEGQFCMLEFEGPPGRSTPMHKHDREEETIHLLNGQLEVTMDGEQLTLMPGDTVLIPRHVAHRLTTVGEHSARYIVVCTPAGFDEFVIACASESPGNSDTPPPSAADVARLREQAPQFGITLIANA